MTDVRVFVAGARARARARNVFSVDGDLDQMLDALQ